MMTLLTQESDQLKSLTECTASLSASLTPRLSVRTLAILAMALVGASLVGSRVSARQQVPAERAHWDAKPGKYFDDPAIQKVCEAISARDLARLKELSHAVELNTTGKINMSLPFWAYLEGNLDALKYLLEQGASPDHSLSEDIKFRGGPLIEGTKGKNLIQHSFFHMMHRVSFFRLGAWYTSDPNQIIVDGKVGYNLLHCYAASGMSKPTVNGVIRLIGKGADLNAKSAQGETACHIASRSNPCSLLVLVVAGADWRIPFPDGSTLVEVVKKKSHPTDNPLHIHYLSVLYWLEEEATPTK